MDQSPRPKLRPKLKLSYNDLMKIERVVNAEAKGEGVEGRNAVRGVIFNRLMSDRFPDTVDEVLSPSQFEPVRKYGSIDKIPVDENTLNEQLTEMADYIQLGEDASKGSTFFLNKELSKKRGTDFGGESPMVIGNHTFYKGYQGQEPVTDVNFSHNIEVDYQGYDEGGVVSKFMDKITSPVTGDYRKEKPLSVKAADTAVSLTTPLDSIVEIQAELEKEEPDYLKIGMLGGIEALSIVGPGIAPAARTMIRKGADMARQTDSAIDVASNVPKVAKSKFKKTRPAYKLFVKSEDEKLYPLFVNASDEIPVNEWLEADFPDVAFKGRTQKGGEGWYVPTKGAKRTKGEKAKATGDRIVIPDEETRQKLIDAGFITEKTGRTKDAPYGKVTAVAARPGFHSSVNPVAEHLGPQDIKVSKAEADKLIESGINPKAIRRRGDQYYVKRRAEDQYWAEVEMADDTSDELRAYMESQGRTDINDKVPKGGSYSYVDGQADGDTWVVGGDMRVKKVLTREEAKAAQEAAGVKDLPYRDEVEAILGRKFAEGGLAGEDMYTGQQDYLLAASSGEEMSEGGSVEKQTEAMFKSSRGYAEGGEVGAAPDTTIGVDPVSGNEVPMGATPEEVRDDIPAQLSEGEYVVPADVVRFYGVKFFEDLRTQAKQGYAEMDRNGRIGGEPVGQEANGMEMVEPEDDLPFDISELQIVDDETGMYEGGLTGYAEGGLPAAPEQTPVPMNPFNPSGTTAGFEIKEYVNDSGDVMYIQFMDGKPMTFIPAGFKPKPTVQEEVQEDLTKDTQSTSVDEGEPFSEPEPTDWSTASPEDFAKAQKGMGLAKTVAGFIPGLGLVGSTMAGIGNRSQAYDMIDGINEQLSDATLDANTRAALQDQKNSLQNAIDTDTTGEGVFSGTGLFGGEESLFDGLNDVNNDGRVDVADTWAGDLLGADGKFGIQGPSLSESRSGGRRSGYDPSKGYTINDDGTVSQGGGAAKDTGNKSSSNEGRDAGSGSGNGNKDGSGKGSVDTSAKDDGLGVGGSSSGKGGSSSGKGGAAAAATGGQGDQGKGSGWGGMNKGGLMKKPNK